VVRANAAVRMERRFTGWAFLGLVTSLA